MPAPEGSPSDHALADTLSARSYLELARQRISSPPRQSLSKQRSTFSGSPIGIGDNSFPHLRSCDRQPCPKHSEKTESESGAKNPLPVDRPPRKRGRPRLDTAKDAAALEERRVQIRRAQRTYRQKKEATIQTLRTRVEVLEHTLQTVSDLLGATDTDADGRADRGNLIRARQLVLEEIQRGRPFPGDQTDQTGRDLDSVRDIFGYHVAHGRREHADNPSSRQHAQERPPRYPRPRSPSPLLSRLFPSNTIYTYSYQESDLSRRLQRFCLEHIYRWQSEPHSDPALMSRVFGLLPCIQDMPGVRRSMRHMLQGEIGGPLEVPKLAFYTLGGAGTHYPRTGHDGQPAYPENMRRPGKIIRRLARILRRGGIQDWDEDWSGDREPDDGDAQAQQLKAMSEDARLRLLDLEGEWFDCHDVQGYLQNLDVVLDGSSLQLEVPASTVKALYGLSPDHAASQFYVSPGELSSSENKLVPTSTDLADFHVFAPSLVLLADVRILGRAPGFRLWDVEAALRTAIQRRSFD
ncbi:hypothetical protein N7462_009224 [Penicillium macrosclerotiorum]|uniref:uncharacterized protein n=1 Tax=Penicillium macrosclerotiorum TaxID=303699 RepID=UPI002549804B|nr:uncharacterized protein N7462_009224 [Penicillium macrosclerotiorum]KAJ5673785.1 hypothetical protein N7462_009224 [Penicillium macrosclerotiorum]